MTSVRPVFSVIKQHNRKALTWGLPLAITTVTVAGLYKEDYISKSWAIILGQPPAVMTAYFVGMYVSPRMFRRALRC